MAQCCRFGSVHVLTGSEEDQSGASVNDPSSPRQDCFAAIGDALVNAPIICGRSGRGQGAKTI